MDVQRDAAFALSASQYDQLVRCRLWGAVECAQLSTTLTDPLEQAVLLQSLQHVLSTHPALRAYFGFDPDFQPWGRVRQHLEPQLAWHDLSTHSKDDARLLYDALRADDRKTAFNLNEALIRFTVVVLCTQDTRLICTYHPALLDRASEAPLLAAIFGAYDLLQGAEPLPNTQCTLPYAEAHAAAVPEARPWWGEPATPPLSELRARNIPGAGCVDATWDPTLACRIEEHCQALNIPTWAFFEAAWLTTLRGLTADAEARSVRVRRVGQALGPGPAIGLLSEASLSPTPARGVVPLRAWLASIAGPAPHDDRSAQPSGAYYDVRLLFESACLDAQVRSLGVAWGPERKATRCGPLTSVLQIQVTAGPALTVRIEYAHARYRRCAIERIQEYLQQAAEGLLDELHGHSQPASLLSRAEHHRVIFDWNQTQDDFPQFQPLHGDFCEQALRSPDRIALICGDTRITYGQLNQRSDDVARGLLNQDDSLGSFIAVCLPRSVDLVVALLGILKAGCAYVPMEPDFPAAHKAHIIGACDGAWVLSDEAARRTLPDGVPARNLKDLETLCAREEGVTLPPISSSAPCYAIFTSGTSGAPKGVVLTHRAVVNTIDAINEQFSVGPQDCLLFVTSICFDLSVYDVFGGLGAGACVHIATEEDLAAPERLAGILRTGQITVWNSAPAAMEQLVPMLQSAPPLPGLRLALLSGDWVALSLPSRLACIFPDIEVVVLGGATECAIWSNYHVVRGIDPLWSSIPYGRPLRNARYYILNERRQPVPWGAPGELYISGTCVARGYLGQPELTDTLFVEDPFFGGRMYRTGDLARHHEDGTLELLGRVDDQVKVRGYRVEPSAIEHQLLTHPDIERCVVLTRKDSGGPSSLCAFVQGCSELSVAALKRHLSTRVPNYMVPGQFEFVDNWPLTANAKVDRAALLALAPSRRHPPAAAHDEAERRMLKLWQDILQLEVVGAQDDFFDLGGHSLLAARLMSRVNEAFCVDLPITSWLEYRTPRDLMTRALEYTPSARSQQGLLRPLSRAGTRPPILVFPGIGGHVFTFRRMALNLGPDQPVYGFDAVGSDGRDQPLSSVPEIARVYLQELERQDMTGPFVVAGYSIGGLVAFEVARQLLERGRRVERLILFDTFAPLWPPTSPLPQRILQHARTLGEQPQGRRRYLKQRATQVKHRLLRSLNRHGALAPSLGDDVSPEQQALVRDVWAALDTARRSYVPTGPVPLAVHLVATEQREVWPATDMSDPQLGWARWTTAGVRRWPVSGQHLSIFEEAHLPSLVHALRDILG